MPLIPCLRCGKLGQGSYCREHAPKRPRGHRVRRRRARLRQQYIEPVNRQEVYARDGGLCWICGRPVSPDAYELDHVIPVAAGGLHAYGNVRVAHPSCNRARTAGSAGF